MSRLARKWEEDSMDCRPEWNDAALRFSRALANGKAGVFHSEVVYSVRELEWHARFRHSVYRVSLWRCCALLFSLLLENWKLLIKWIELKILFCVYLSFIIYYLFHICWLLLYLISKVFYYLFVVVYHFLYLVFALDLLSLTIESF